MLNKSLPSQKAGRSRAFVIQCWTSRWEEATLKYHKTKSQLRTRNFYTHYPQLVCARCGSATTALNMVFSSTDYNSLARFQSLTVV